MGSIQLLQPMTAEILFELMIHHVGRQVHTMRSAHGLGFRTESLAASLRDDIPHVSADGLRHALIVRQPDGVRVLDDRSLNGVFVNDARIEGQTLKDGDEILVGRYRLNFLSVASA